MNRDGFSLLVMGFTGSKALEWKVRYIQAFNAMEAKLAMEHQDSYMIADPIARALKWAEEEKKRRALQATCSQQEQLIGELKPKADYVDKILKSNSLVTITQIAKDYGMSGQGMNKVLHDLHIIYSCNKQWLLYSQYQAKGYTFSETVDIPREDGTTKVVMNTKWTQKGRLFLYETLKKRNLLPLIERKEQE